MHALRREPRGASAHGAAHNPRALADDNGDRLCAHGIALSLLSVPCVEHNARAAVVAKFASMAPV